MEQLLSLIAHGRFHWRQYAAGKARWKTESRAVDGSVRHLFSEI
jgi:hypothetical protein